MNVFVEKYALILGFLACLEAIVLEKCIALSVSLIISDNQ